jgi:hypothetical protein
MSITHTPDPIVYPERLFEGFENLMPFRVQNLFFGAGKKKQCHPERSVCFAKRSRCGVEGPLSAGVKLNAERRSHKAAE